MIILISRSRMGIAGVIGSSLLVFATQMAPAGETMPVFEGVLSADIVEEVSGREIREHRSHVWLSERGLAVETKGTPGRTPRIIYLYNHNEEKSWIVSPDGKRYCELTEEEDEPEVTGGMLSSKPCLGLNSTKLKEFEWNNQVVSVWQCHKQEVDLGKQYFSEVYGIVVKEEGEDGIIRELKNLNQLDSKQLKKITEGITREFTPVDDYRAVTVNDFFFAKRPLQNYLE